MEGGSRGTQPRAMLASPRRHRIPPVHWKKPRLDPSPDFRYKHLILQRGSSPLPRLPLNVIIINSSPKGLCSGQWASTPPPLYVTEASQDGRRASFLPAFPTAKATNFPFSHGEHQVPSGPSDGGARGEETAAPTPFRVADSHLSPSSLPGCLFFPQNLPKQSLAEASRCLVKLGRNRSRGSKKVC